MGDVTALDMAKVGINNQNRRVGFGDQMSKYGAIQGALGGKIQGINRAAEEGRESGKEGYSNFKDLMKLGAGF